MSEPEKPQLPNTPSYYTDPNFQLNLNSLTNLGQGLTSGQFLDPTSSLGFLNQLVELNPQATQQAVGLATRSVERTRDRAQQDIINQLEANNQLTSSVAVNRLSELNQEFGRDIADINTRFYLADVERSLANTLNLFGTGLNTTQNAAQLGFQNQQLTNQFNLENYPNQVAKAQSEADQGGRGGLFGGILGTAVGALAAPFTGGLSLAAGAGIGGALGSGIGELISPSATGNVATSFGTSALGLLGSQPLAGTGTQRFTSGLAENPRRLLGTINQYYQY